MLYTEDLIHRSIAVKYKPYCDNCALKALGLTFEIAALDSAAEGISERTVLDFIDMNPGYTGMKLTVILDF